MLPSCHYRSWANETPRSTSPNPAARTAPRSPLPGSSLSRYLGSKTGLGLRGGVMVTRSEAVQLASHPHSTADTMTACCAGGCGRADTAPRLERDLTRRNGSDRSTRQADDDRCRYAG